jgi:predicted transcriptional regulator
MTIIKGTNKRCKDNGAVESNFNKVPDSIFNYVELGLISGNDLMVWIKLYQFDNNQLGYAFPSLPQLMICTNLSKGTLLKSIANLEKVDLIKKEKIKVFNSNIYFVFKPLEKDELYQLSPSEVEQLRIKKQKYSKIAEHDKERLQEWINFHWD